MHFSFLWFKLLGHYRLNYKSMNFSLGNIRLWLRQLGKSTEFKVLVVGYRENKTILKPFFYCDIS